MNIMDLKKLVPTDTSFASVVKESDTTDLYAATLDLQASLNKKEFTSFLSSNKAWIEANSIIEVGCGTGAGAKALEEAGLLDSKKYLGIDVQEQFINEASRKASHLEFRCSDFLNSNLGKFDVVLAVAALQHLGDLSTAISKLRNCLNSNGRMIFFDTGGNTFSDTSPLIPTIDEMYKQISAKSTDGKRNDKCLIELEENAKHWGLKVDEVKDPQIRVSEFSLNDFVLYSYFASELTIRFYNAAFSQEKLLKELLHWKGEKGSASLSGWRWLVATQI